MNKLSIGAKVKFSQAAIDNYGEQYKDQVFVVEQYYDHYLPASEMLLKDDPHGHPGYDGAGPNDRLYHLNGLNFDLYRWELKLA